MRYQGCGCIPLCARGALELCHALAAFLFLFTDALDSGAYPFPTYVAFCAWFRAFQVISKFCVFLLAVLFFTTRRSLAFGEGADFD